MTDVLGSEKLSLPSPRDGGSPGTAASEDSWTQPTPESRRRSELEQLAIDLAAGR